MVHPSQHDPRAVIHFFGGEGSLPKFIGGCVWTPYLSNGRQQMTGIQEPGLAPIVAMVQWLDSSPGNFVHMGYVGLCLSWIATQMPMVGLYWVPGHAGMRGNEIADKLARDGSVQRFVGPEPFSGDSRQNIRRKTNR